MISQTIQAESDSVYERVTLPSLTLNKPNANGRTYTDQCFNEITSIIEQKRAFAAVHVTGRTVDLLHNVFGVVESAVRHPDDTVDVVVRMMQVPAAPIAKALIESGKATLHPFGVGRIDENGVVTDYRFQGFSLIPTNENNSCG